MDSVPLVTPVWRLIGITRSVPGVLRMVDGRISFVTASGVIFDEPAEVVEGVRFPWYYFSGGVKLKVHGEEYRFSFLKPDAGDEVPEHLLEGAEGSSRKGRVMDAAGALALDFEAASFARGRRAGKAWRARLRS